MSVQIIPMRISGICSKCGLQKEEFYSQITEDGYYIEMCMDCYVLTLIKAFLEMEQIDGLENTYTWT